MENDERRARGVLILAVLFASATLFLGCGDDGDGANGLPPVEPPPGASSGDMCAFNTAASASTAIDALLQQDVEPELNSMWPQTAVEKGLDPYSTGSQQTDVPDGCSKQDDYGYALCAAEAADCKKVTADFNATVHGLSALVFADLAVKSLTTQDLSSFTSRGPDVSHILTNSHPADGSSWNSSGAVVLPASGPASAITIDLGDVYTLCGDEVSCPPLMFQGSANDTYRVEYSLDGSEWTPWVDIPPLYAPPEDINSLFSTPILAPGNPSARYVRIYAVSTIGSSEQYSVSWLVFFSLNPTLQISLGKPARGPQPLFTSSPYPASNGSAAWNDPLATVLPNEGPDSAATIDMGRVVYTQTEDLPGIQLLVSGNDEYRLEYSNDAISWVQWVEVPQRCGCSELEIENPTAPNVSARYFRIYHPSGTPGDGKYSVGMFLFLYSLDPSSTDLLENQNAATFGPEALATNSEFAPAGTSWNDSRFASVLGGTGTGNALLIDLGQSAGRGINRVKIQADHNDVYQVDISPDGQSWSPLYTANTLSSGGLQTRDSGDSLTDPSTGKPWVGRYVRVYAVSGDGKYSVSEVEIFNDVLAGGCPFDADANSIALGSAECSYSGDVVGDAALPSGEPLIVDLTDVKVEAHCDGLFGSSTIRMWPLLSSSGSADCDLDPFGLETDVDFCSVSCGAGSDPQFELTYQQLESAEPESTVGAPSCNASEAFDSADLQDAVTGAIGEVVRDQLAPVLRDAQNALLRDETPFPGETLPGGEPGVCTQ